MTMTKELESRLKLMQRFNQVRNKRYDIQKIYKDKIFVHNDIMYATDGYIFVVAKNLTEQKDFSVFKCQNKNFTYLDSTVQEVKEDKIELRDGEALECIITQFKHNTSLSFDIDFEGYPLPLKLCNRWGSREQDKLTINFQTSEAIFDFCGGSDEMGGVTGTYGDIIKNVSGEIPEAPLKLVCCNIIEIMRQCKVKKIHIESYPDRKQNTCKVGDYTFYFMSRN